MSAVIKLIRNNKLLLAIVVIAVLLRFVGLSSIPVSLNHDETAIGYNAYSILKTGADEYGKIFPLSLKSFGDWKLPVYPLLTIIPIIFFGLSEFAVRVPSATAGVILILLVYIFAFQLFEQRRTALLAAFFLAISPWGVFFSRIAYEANLATAFLLGGLVAFMKVYKYKESSKWLLITSLLWGLTIFTYHAFVVFTPIFFISSLFLLSRSGKNMKDKWLLAAVFVFLFFVLMSIFSTFVSGSLNKLSSTSLFDDKHMINERVNILRGDTSNENELASKVLHNKYAAVLYQIGQNYLSTYSPSFLFDKGGEKFLHNIGNFGNFYLFDAILMAVGFLALFARKIKGIGILVLWFLLGPIPSAITTDSPSSTRLFLMLPAFILVASYGASRIFDYLLKMKKILSVPSIIVLVALFALNFIYFIDAYFIHMNYHRAQFFHYGYKEAVELSNKYPDYEVEMYDPTNFPYISFLFYNKYDPLKFREEAEYYPNNFGPFYYVKSFGRYRFVDDIDYENLKDKVLYIDYRGIRDIDMKILDPSGKPVFKYFFKEQ